MRLLHIEAIISRNKANEEGEEWKSEYSIKRTYMIFTWPARYVLVYTLFE